MFSRTSSGIQNIHLFYNGCYLVIVEGDSDQPFWSNFFPATLGEYKRKFKPVGGKAEVNKFVNELSSGRGAFIVALDSDYRLLKDEIHSHERIVETFGHSIENLIICDSNILSVICNLAQNPEYNQEDIDSWLEHFDQFTHSLMVVDFLIDKENLGIQCIGDNCSRFFKKNGCHLDDHKIETFISSLSISEEVFEAAKEQLLHVRPRYHIRGHFFFSAVLRFITHEAKRVRRKKVSFSKDSLYTVAFSTCEQCLSENPILLDVKEKAETASQNLYELLKS